jgi:CARDB protein
MSSNSPRSHRTHLLATAFVTAFAATAAAASGPRPLVTPAQSPSAPAAPQEVFEYVAKLICGAQEDPKDMRLAKGFYATTINVHNPNREFTRFFKKLALTIPPGDQRPGPILPIATDGLEYDQALAVDCDDVARRLFGGTLPAPFIEGYIVIQSERSLDVTGVYSTATVRDGMAEEHSSIHVEQIRERAPRSTPPPGQPDLTVRDITNISVSCPGGGGTCVTTAKVTIENLNATAAGPFTTKSVFDPGQSVSVNTPSAGLAGGTTLSFTVTTPPGGNCFDPDCTVCVTVDSANTVSETNEGNNQLCKTTIG